MAGVFIVLAACLGVGCVHHAAKPHEHCMKIAGLVFMEFAAEHDGRFPFHTNGFGDALLLLVKDNAENIRFVCGPGDDGRVFRDALAYGTNVPESQCSRVYVQGLCQTNDPQLCILFDRRSVRGGDHFYGSGRRVREVCMLDGSMQTIPDAGWAKFKHEQVQLLEAAGFKREQALEYYRE